MTKHLGAAVVLLSKLSSVCLKEQGCLLCPVPAFGWPPPRGARAIFTELGLCLHCLLSLKSSHGCADGGQGLVHSLYDYEGGMRELILAVKRQGHAGAGEVLLRLFQQHTRTAELALWAEAVMPAPSSLWGRVSGRMDLAWLLAEGISTRFGLPLWEVPRRAYMRLAKKQALKKDRTSMDLNALPGRVVDPQASRVLLIDDIITSGETLYRTAYAAGTYCYKYLTLASAYRLPV